MRRPYPLLTFLALLGIMTLCPLESLNPKRFVKKVENYPVSFAGSAEVAVPYDAATCTRTGKATLTVNSDGCAFYASYPMTIINTQGQCVENGDTEAWLLKGTLDQNMQACNFVSCNDNPDYEGSGAIAFSADATDPGSLTCSIGGKTEVTITVGALTP